MNSSLMLYIDSMGWTLIHALWQGSLIWLLFRLTQTMLRSATPVQRHANALLWLVVILLTPLFTFMLHISRDASALALSESGIGTMSPVLGVTLAPLLVDFATRFTVQNTALPSFAVPALALLWLACVSGRCWRLRSDWCDLSQMVHRHSYRLSLSDFNWGPLLQAMNTPKCVRIRESLEAQVPMVVGWFKPVILLPTSALLGLSPRELELIVAHELGHIRRHDHRINYLLIIAETALFFHPAVFAITSVIRHERELCVDDLVIHTFKERLCYAHALSKLETLRGEDVYAPSWQIAATDGPLVKRITRMVEGRSGSRRSGRALMSALAVWMLGFATIIWVQQHSAVSDTQSVLLPEARDSSGAALGGLHSVPMTVPSPWLGAGAEPDNLLNYEQADASRFLPSSMLDSMNAAVQKPASTLIPLSLESQRHGAARVLTSRSDVTDAIKHHSPSQVVATNSQNESEQTRDEQLGLALRNKELRDQVYDLLVNADTRHQVLTDKHTNEDAQRRTGMVASSKATPVPDTATVAKKSETTLGSPEVIPKFQPATLTAESRIATFSQINENVKRQNYLFESSDRATEVVAKIEFPNEEAIYSELAKVEFKKRRADDRATRDSAGHVANPVAYARNEVKFNRALAPADVLPVAFTLHDHRSNPRASVIDQYEVFDVKELVAEQGGELLKGREPRYPTRARGRGLTGKVTVALTIDTGGQVVDVEVTSKDSRPMFRRAVVRAVSRWSYAPLIRNGEAVERKLVQSFEFRLEENTTARNHSRAICNTSACVAST